MRLASITSEEENRQVAELTKEYGKYLCYPVLIDGTFNM